MQNDRILHRLKLRDLRILLAVTQTGSMAKAATQLATSQPAVSRAISDMEATLGVSLLNRSSQGVEPTPYGQALIKRGIAVFDELRQGVKEIEFIADPTVGEVRIGATSSLSAGLVAAVIDRMSRKYPRVSFRVVADGPPGLARRLRERNLDLIIWRILGPVRDEDIDSETLFEDRQVVVAAADNPWSRRRQVGLAELANEIWTLPEPEHPIGAALVEAFRANEVEAPVAIVTTSDGNLRDTLLGTGRFLTLLPESLLHFCARLSSLKVLPVDLPTTRGKTSITTLKNRELSPVAKLFIECAREVAKPLAKGK
jgi:DNA-binding transcriptional LysR family regulator